MVCYYDQKWLTTKSFLPIVYRPLELKAIIATDAQICNWTLKQPLSRSNLMLPKRILCQRFSLFCSLVQPTYLTRPFSSKKLSPSLCSHWRLGGKLSSLLFSFAAFHFLLPRRSRFSFGARAADIPPLAQSWKQQFVAWGLSPRIFFTKSDRKNEVN